MKKYLIENKIWIILLLVFLIVVSPVLLNNIYNHPAADDYYGINAMKGLLGVGNFNIKDLFLLGLAVLWIHIITGKETIQPFFLVHSTRF